MDVSNLFQGLLSGGEPYRAALGGLLSGDTAPLQGLLGPRKPWPTMDQVKQYPTTLSQEDVMNNPGVNIAMQFAPFGMTSYHGTPHVWPPEPGFPNGRPRLDKIGTGEGAQAYGWGWYSADNPEVAQSYGLSDVGKNRQFKSVTYNGETIEVGNGNSNMLFDIAMQGRKPVINRLLEQADRVEKTHPEFAIKLREKAEFAKTVNPDDVKINGGNLYKLDIPDTVKPYLLDWDKPLSEQTPEVKAALKEFPPNLRGQDIYSSIKYGQKPQGFNEKGEALFDGVAALNAPRDSAKNAAAYLASKGIVGTRYLDGASRGKGEGSFNYVIWDQPTLDSIPLLERNGEPLK